MLLQAHFSRLEVGRELALDTSTALLERAIASDPSYADPHCFLAIIAANFRSDPPTARSEADQCLANDPPADMRALIEQFVDRLDDAPASSTP